MWYGMQNKPSRRRSPEAQRLVAAVALAMVCALGLGVLAGCSGDIFTVNKQGITRARFEAEVNRRLALVKKNNPKELEGSRGTKLKATTQREVATEMIRRTLMEQQAAKLGVALAVDAVNQKIADERRQAGTQKFDADMKKQGLTEAEYADRVRGELLVAALGQKIGAGVTVTKDQAEAFYLTHKQLFARSLMVHAAHIFVDTQGQADVIAEQLRNGADFAQLARSVSKDAATAFNGGDMGWIENGSMDPAFEQAAFALKTGQTSGVVKASDGFHIIRILDRREASTPAFSEVWSQAMNTLQTRKQEEAFSDWLRTVYANAKVDAGGVGVWDPRLGMVVQKK